MIAATGLGKTFLSAFDSIPFRRVLFVEIHVVPDTIRVGELLQSIEDFDHFTGPYARWCIWKDACHDRAACPD